MSSGSRSSDPADEARAAAERLAALDERIARSGSPSSSSATTTRALSPTGRSPSRRSTASSPTSTRTSSASRARGPCSRPSRVASSSLKAPPARYFVWRWRTDGSTPTYFESRLRVGDAHQRIGLEPEWYIGRLQPLYLRLAAAPLVADAGDRRPRRCPPLEALIKTVLPRHVARDRHLHPRRVRRPRRRRRSSSSAARSPRRRWRREPRSSA